MYNASAVPWPRMLIVSAGLGGPHVVDKLPVFGRWRADGR